MLQFPREEDGDPLFDDLICKSCVPKCLFLSKYPDLVIAPSAIPDVSTDPVEIVDQMDGSGMLAAITMSSSCASTFLRAHRKHAYAEALEFLISYLASLVSFY